MDGEEGLWKDVLIEKYSITCLRREWEKRVAMVGRSLKML